MASTIVMIQRATIALTLLLAGCATNVTVKGNYPTPLADEIPITAGLYFDDQFKNFAFADNSGRKEVEIKFGDANMRLFRTVSAGIFAQSVELAAMPNDTAPTDPPVDMVLVPHVEEVQISMPYDTQLKVFEVWVKYNLQVFDSEGNAIADWIMTAYGKTPTRTLTSDSTALNQASIMALRDAGARITTSLTRVPEVEQWLNQKLAQRNADLTPGPAQESSL